MMLPMLAGSYPPALLQLVRACALDYERRNQLYPAVKNVNLETYKPMHRPLDAKAESGA